MTRRDQMAAAVTQADLDDEQRRFAILLAGLDLIDQGLSVFDSELRVVAINRRMMELLDFPAEMARAGTPFVDFVRYNARRGEYGEGNPEDLVAERMELARKFETHRFERTRPDGTVLDIRGAPLPYNGWVALYTDVSDQRRNEKQIKEQHARIQEHNAQLEQRVRERTAELEEANARLREANEQQRKLHAVLVHAQKMEAVGAMTGGLAHSFNNLLTIVISNLAALRDHAAPGASAGAAEFVESALVAALKGADITRRLLAFARRQPLEPRIIEVNRLISNLLALSRHSMPEAIHIAKETVAGDLHTRVDPEQLEHALLNLVLNARDAMPRGGNLVIRSSRRQLNEQEAVGLQVEPGSYVELRVEDTGTGMDEATRSRVFEPFFTTKLGESGSGLGLSMVYGFVQQSGGTLDVFSVPDAGTVVTLLLPLSPPPEPEVPACPSESASTDRLVLLVEDNADVRAVLRRQLNEIGHMVIEVSNGQEALAIVESVPELGVLVSDIVMPGAMDGRRLAALTRQRRPDLRVVLVTGYADGLDTEADRPFKLLRKPCTKEELAAAIAAPLRSS